MKSLIRQLTIEDYDAIIQLWADAGLPYKTEGRDARKQIEKEMARNHCAYFGMFDNGRMIGVGLANFDGRKGWISRLAVDPEYRGQRLAGQIIRECEKFLENCGALVIACLIEDLNLPSMACFAREGYSCMDNIKYFSKRPSDKA